MWDKFWYNYWDRKLDRFLDKYNIVPIYYLQFSDQFVRIQGKRKYYKTKINA